MDACQSFFFTEVLMKKVIQLEEELSKTTSDLAPASVGNQRFGSRGIRTRAFEIGCVKNCFNFEYSQAESSSYRRSLNRKSSCR